MPPQAQVLVSTPKTPSAMIAYAPTVFPYGTATTRMANATTVFAPSARPARPIESLQTLLLWPDAAASSDTYRSSYDMVIDSFPMATSASYISWPAGRVAVLFPLSATGMGFPSGSIVIPLRKFPFSAARTPVATSPTRSDAMPFAMVL